MSNWTIWDRNFGITWQLVRNALVHHYIAKYVRIAQNVWQMVALMVSVLVAYGKLKQLVAFFLFSLTVFLVEEQSRLMFLEKIVWFLFTRSTLNSGGVATKFGSKGPVHIPSYFVDLSPNNVNINLHCNLHDNLPKIFESIIPWIVNVSRKFSLCISYISYFYLLLVSKISASVFFL